MVNNTAYVYCTFHEYSIQPLRGLIFFANKERILRPLFCNFFILSGIDRTLFIFLPNFIFYPDRTSEGHINCFVRSSPYKVIFNKKIIIIYFLYFCPVLTVQNIDSPNILSYNKNYKIQIRRILLYGNTYKHGKI